MKLIMFQTVPLSIIMSFSLYTQQWYMSACEQDQDSILILPTSCLQNCMTYHCCVYSEKLLMMVRGTV